MRGFKMLRKKEREEIVSQIRKNVKEELEAQRPRLKESERIIFDEILKANKEGDIQLSLTGAGISKDHKKILIKGELLIDIEEADRIMKM